MRAIELFCGAGGLSLGLKQAGWDVSTVVEFDRAAIESHTANLPDTTHLTADVREVDFTQFKGIDLVAGGPPCQPFSVSGKRLGNFDVRDMVPEFVRAVREIRPAAFLMENVAGLVAVKFAAYLQEKVRDLEALGYRVSKAVLNAADYGVPQNRKRLFLVGIRDDVGALFKFPAATHGPLSDNDYVSVKEALVDVPQDIPNNAKVVFCKTPVMRSSPYAGMLLNGKGRPIRMDGLCHTIPASAGGNRTHVIDVSGEISKYHEAVLNGKKVKKESPRHARRLTVRESARIQSFPDDFNFLGRQSSRYSQVGNAVPPKLAQAVAGALAEVMK